MSAFRDAGPAPNDDHQPTIYVTAGEPEKIVAITGDEHALIIYSMLEHALIGSLGIKRGAYVNDVVPSLSQYPRHIIRDIVIDQKLHPTGSAICCATARSISAL